MQGNRQVIVCGFITSVTSVPLVGIPDEASQNFGYLSAMVASATICPGIALPGDSFLGDIGGSCPHPYRFPCSSLQRTRNFIMRDLRFLSATFRSLCYPSTANGWVLLRHIVSIGDEKYIHAPLLSPPSTGVRGSVFFKFIKTPMGYSPVWPCPIYASSP